MFDKNGGTVVQDAGIWINSMDFRHPLSAIKEAYSKSDAASLVTGLQPVTIARHRSAIGAQYSFLRSGEVGFCHVSVSTTHNNALDRLCMRMASDEWNSTRFRAYRYATQHQTSDRNGR